MTCSGRLFQTRAAATGKARSPTVDRRVRLTISDEDELERSRCNDIFIINYNVSIHQGNIRILQRMCGRYIQRAMKAVYSRHI